MLIGLGQLPPQQPAPRQAPQAAPLAYTPGSAETMTDQQAEQYAKDPRLNTVALWAENPKQVAELEATALMVALDQLKAEAVPLAQELQRIQRAEGTSRANLARMRAEIDALSRQGMGEIMALERETGEWVDPFMAGFMSSVRKAVSNAVETVKDTVTRPAGEALKEVDRAVIRPWSSPLNSALKEVDRAIIRPWSSPLHTALKKIEKYTIRPAAKEVKKGIAILDKYVPGWTTLLDVIMPLPIGTIIGGLAASAGSGNLISSIVNTIPGLKTSDAVAGLAKVGDIAAREAFVLASPVTSPFVTQLANSFPLTVAKGTHTYLKTKGSFLDKLRATATEAIQGFTLVVQLAAVVATGGALAPAIAALNVILAGLQAGITVLNAHDAAVALKKHARTIRDAANAELARIQAEETATLAEIARLRANIEEVRRRRLALAKQQADQAAAQRRAEAGVVGQVSEELGVSEETLVLGGLAVVGGLILIIAVSGD